MEPTTVANNATRARRNRRKREHGHLPPKDSLSPRETEVGKLLAEGLSVKEVALQLKISLRTAETHLQHINGKLGLHRRCELVMYFAKPNVNAVWDTLTNSMSPEFEANWKLH